MYTTFSKNAIRVNRGFEWIFRATKVDAPPSVLDPRLRQVNKNSHRFERIRSDFGHNDRADCAAEDKRDGITAEILVPRVGLRMPRSEKGKAFR